MFLIPENQYISINESIDFLSQSSIIADDSDWTVGRGIIGPFGPVFAEKSVKSRSVGKPVKMGIITKNANYQTNCHIIKKIMRLYP